MMSFSLRPPLLLAALVAAPVSMVLGARQLLPVGTPATGDSSAVTLFTADERPAPWLVRPPASEHILPTLPDSRAPTRIAPSPAIPAHPHR